MSTDWDYLNMYLDTDNDAEPVLARMSAGMEDLTRLAPACAPKAATALAAFAGTVETVMETYQTRPAAADAADGASGSGSHAEAGHGHLAEDGDLDLRLGVGRVAEVRRPSAGPGQGTGDPRTFLANEGRLDGPTSGGRVTAWESPPRWRDPQSWVHRG